jgi:hypothetical protein
MKQNSLILAAALLISGSCACTNPDTDYTQTGDLVSFSVNGPVKSIYTLEYNVREENGALIPTDTTGNRLVTFNEKGMVEEVSFFDTDSSISRLETTKYDLDGFKSEVVVEDNLWNSVEKTVYQRGEGLKPSGYEVFYEQPDIKISGLRTKGAYQYNDQGKVIEETQYTPSGELIRKQTYSYLENGHRLSEAISYSNNDVKSRSEVEYNAQDKFIRYSQYDAAGKLVDEDLYTRNGNGQWTERSSRSTNGFTTEAASYNDKGFIVAITKSDSLGNSISKTTYAPELDQYDNMVFELTRVDGKAVSVTRRTIEYYRQ